MENTYPIIPILISHLVYDQNSGQKIFFLKIPIFKKVTGPEKKMVPQILSNDKIAPPPLSIWAQIFGFFQSFPKSSKNCLYGFSKPKFSILSTQKSKIVILVPEIAQIYHSAIFRKNRFFHVFKVF